MLDLAPGFVPGAGSLGGHPAPSERPAWNLHGTDDPPRNNIRAAMAPAALARAAEPNRRSCAAGSTHARSLGSARARRRDVALAQAPDGPEEVDRLERQLLQGEDAAAHLVVLQLGDRGIVAEHDQVDLRQVIADLVDQRVMLGHRRIEADQQGIDLAAADLLQREDAHLLVDLEVAEGLERDLDLATQLRGGEGKEEPHAAPIGRRHEPMKSPGEIAVGGIDEAGLGPTLGPLVFGATLFTGPAAALHDLRATLGTVVARDFDPSGRRIGVDDSKRLFTARQSLVPLELPALALLRPEQAELPATLEALLHDVTAAAGWPEWYRAEEPLATAIDAGVIAGWRRRLAAAFAAAGVACAVARAEPLFEAELNAGFARGRNKAELVLDRVGPLLLRLVAAAGDRAVEIAVDRLGGRRYYGDFLRHLFPLRPLRTLEETPDCSRYRIDDGARRIEIAFEVGGDQRHLAVAWASLCAKYLRERFMARFNRWFGARKPGLAPTAGYPEDARRWLAEAGDVLSATERGALVRER